MDAQNIASLNKLMLKSIMMSYGYQIMPIDVDQATTYNSSSGSFFYALKAINGDVRIDSATDLQGNTVLSGIEITQGDIIYFPLSEFTLDTGRVIAYKALLLDAELV